MENFNPNDINSILTAMVLCKLTPNPGRWEPLYNTLQKLLNDRLGENNG